MPRRALALMLLMSAPALAAEHPPPPAVKSAAEAMPAPKQVAGGERKAVERKAGEALNSSRGTPKPPPPALEERNLGLGCVEN